LQSPLFHYAGFVCLCESADGAKEALAPFLPSFIQYPGVYHTRELRLNHRTTGVLHFNTIPTVSNDPLQSSTCLCLVSRSSRVVSVHGPELQGLPRVQGSAQASASNQTQVCNCS